LDRHFTEVFLQTGVLDERLGYAYVVGVIYYVCLMSLPTIFHLYRNVHLYL